MNILKSSMGLKMDSENTGQHQHFTKFADALRGFVIDSFDDENQHNPFDVVKEFRSIAGDSAYQLVNDQDHVTSCRDWELEARFWQLFDILLSFRTSDELVNDISIKPFNSAAVLEKKLLRTNKDLYQIWLIMCWLRENIIVGDRPEDLPTSKWTNSIISGGLKSADLDYPLREKNAEIDIRDKHQDHALFKYVYKLLLAGRFEEAFEECKLSDNLTLCMILCGMQEYLNPEIDDELSEEFNSQQGVKKHALWRRTVYNLSKSDNLDPYERAIYNYLSGSMPDSYILKESTWDSELLLNLNQIFQTEVENYMIKNGKVENDELITPLPTKPLSVDQVLNSLASKFPQESEHPIRVLMASVILNTLPEVLHSSVEMLMDVVKGYETSNDLLDEPYFLRIVAHASILLDMIQPGCIDENDKVKLLTAYVSILKLHGLYDSIPVYISFLEERDALDAYSFILCSLEEPRIREKQLEMMKFLRLPTANILRKAVERVFDETEDHYTPNSDISVTYDVSDIDIHFIHTVEWLVEAKLYTDAVESIVALSRRFLINGKVKSLQYFVDSNSLEEIINGYHLENIRQEGNDYFIKEIKQYVSLIDGLKIYEEWQKSVKLLNSESNIPSLIEKFQAYSNTTVDLIKTFLVELTDDRLNDDYPVRYEIRSLYTPYLIIELHKGLVEAAQLLKIPTFIDDALEFTNLVANETNKIYLLFQSSGKLKEYLQLVAHTATLVE